MPWEIYLNVIQHAWSALVIQNKLVPNGRDVLGTHDVFDLSKLMLSITKLQHTRDLHWLDSFGRKITTPVLLTIMVSTFN